MKSAKSITSTSLCQSAPQKWFSTFLEILAVFTAGMALSSAQVVQTLSPESNGTPAAAGDLALQITYDVDVAVGTGSVTVTDLDTFLPVATFDITDPSQATVSGNTVTFATFPAVGGAQYNIEAPTGFVVAANGGAPAPGFGFNPGDGIWVFDVVAPDTTPPVITGLSPQNGQGASNSSTLTVTYDEFVMLGGGPWTIEVFDVTADAVLESFSETDTAAVTAVGTRLSITLSSALDFNNDYRVTASAGVVMDAAGNLSGAIAVGDWEFTTGDPFTRGQVVISQAYGGGGNSGATLRNDFVELHNRTNSPISLEGWSVQYASAAGTFSVASNSVVLTGTIAPGGYYLVQGAAGTGGSQDLPTPDASGGMALSGTNGKVLLSSASDLIGAADPLTEPTVSDLVAYGSATPFEGSGAAPRLSNTTAVFRAINGSQDTDDNAADFSTATPAPRNSSSPTFFPGNDGSGIAVASNQTSGAGTLLGSTIFPSAATAQTLQIDIIGTQPAVALETVEIDLPADLGNVLSSNIVLSGTGANGGSASVSGSTVTVSGVAITTADSLNLTISNITIPDASADANDDGVRALTIRTASAGGSPIELVTSPSLGIAIPVSNLAELRDFDPSDKTFLIPNEVFVTFFDPALFFRNQHYIQDSTAGILIDDQPNNLGASYDFGDGLTNLVGTLSTFSGILQFNPILAVPNASSTGNDPQPVVATLAEINADPEAYESRLVRVNALTFQDSAGIFENGVENVLVQGADTFGFRGFIGADYVGTAVPSASLDLIGISRPLVSGTENGLSPRFLADFIGEGIFPDPGNGSGLATATNVSATSGNLSGTSIFPSLAGSQTLQVAVTGTLADTIVETVEVDVPTDFGTLTGSNVSISGAAAGTGLATLDGRTITVSGVAITQTESLVISIAGLTTPDVSTDPDDDGFRTFALRTAIASDTPRTVAAEPEVRIAMTVADLATLRAAGANSPKAFITANPAIVTYVEVNQRNQRYIQDSTAGILIDDSPGTLTTPNVSGDALSNIVGTLTAFRGTLQFVPIVATATVTSSGNVPTPIVVTFAELEANPLTYQSRLVRVNGVTFQDSTGTFTVGTNLTLDQGIETLGFASFFGADYVGTQVPSTTVDIVGIARRIGNDTLEGISPRSLADITESGAVGDPAYADFSTDFAGGQGPLLDFDGDGVRNGLEYLFGVDTAGFTPTPQIVNGEITWPIDPTRTDVGFVVETSDDLVDWDPVLEADLDLSDPNAVRYVIPTGAGPFFVRIGATFAPEPN